MNGTASCSVGIVKERKLLSSINEFKANVAFRVQIESLVKDCALKLPPEKGGPFNISIDHIPDKCMHEYSVGWHPRQLTHSVSGTWHSA